MKKPKLFVRSELETKFGSLPTTDGKKKLADYAQKNYGVKLARNKSFENMMNDLEEAVNATFESARQAVGDAKEEIDLDERVDLSEGIELDPDLMDEDEDEEVKSLAPIAIEEIQSDPIPIADLEPEVKAEIVEAIKTGKAVIEAPLVPVATVESIKDADVKQTDSVTLSFPSEYTPKYKLVGPEGRSFINIPYWIHDWMQGRPWKSEISECPYDKELLKSLAFYIERDGSVAIRESRNSKFIVIS